MWGDDVLALEAHQVDLVLRRHELHRDDRIPALAVARTEDLAHAGCGDFALQHESIAEHTELAERFLPDDAGEISGSQRSREPARCL